MVEISEVLIKLCNCKVQRVDEISLKMLKTPGVVVVDWKTGREVTIYKKQWEGMLQLSRYNIAKPPVEIIDY